jgi:hypothetical protein
MKRALLFLPVVFAFVAFTHTAVAKDQRFLVITSHTPETCLATLDAIDAKSEKFLAKFDWGCMTGDHTGYAVLEAKDEAAARAMLPPSLKDVRLVNVTKFMVMRGGSPGATSQPRGVARALWYVSMWSGVTWVVNQCSRKGR